MCRVFPTVTSCNLPNVGAGGGEQVCLWTKNLFAFCHHSLLGPQRPLCPHAKYHQWEDILDSLVVVSNSLFKWLISLLVCLGTQFLPRSRLPSSSTVSAQSCRINFSLLFILFQQHFPRFDGIRFSLLYKTVRSKYDDDIRKCLEYILRCVWTLRILNIVWQKQKLTNLIKTFSKGQIGDWFVLYQLCKNCNPYFFRWKLFLVFSYLNVECVRKTKSRLKSKVGCFREFIRELAIELRHRPKRSKSRSHSIGEKFSLRTNDSEKDQKSVLFFQAIRARWRKREERYQEREARTARTRPPCWRLSMRNGEKCKYQPRFSFFRFFRKTPMQCTNVKLHSVIWMFKAKSFSQTHSLAQFIWCQSLWLHESVWCWKYTA